MSPFSLVKLSKTFESLGLEQSYIHQLKALMYGINASRGQGRGCRFTMCHTSENMALLLHKEGLVKTTVPITVHTLDNLISIRYLLDFFNKYLSTCNYFLSVAKYAIHKINKFEELKNGMTASNSNSFQII